MRKDLTATLVAVLVGFSLCGAPAIVAEGDAPPAAHRDSGSTTGSVLVVGNTAFAVDLYQRLRSGEGNLFFSPFSISAALAMTYAGARGSTEQEMAAVLHFTLPQSDLHPAMGQLAQRLEAAGPQIANRLWAQVGARFLEVYLRTNRDCYGADLERVDFAGDIEAARQTINRWISERTRDRIPELLHPRDVDRETSLVLTNTIYFKGLWATRFPAGATQPHPFHVDARRSIEVPTMRLTAPLRLARLAGFVALELPYQDSDLAMVILLPGAVDGLGDLEKELSVAMLGDCLARLVPTRVDVQLPRVRLRSRFDLADVLGAMGMPSAFQRGADFSGMTGARELFIGKVIHEAEVAVDEEGTEASAATAVVMKRTAAVEEPIPFTADHPFLFLIHDRQSGSVLFMGRVLEP